MLRHCRVSLDRGVHNKRRKQHTSPIVDDRQITTRAADISNVRVVSCEREEIKRQS